MLYTLFVNRKGDMKNEEEFIFLVSTSSIAECELFCRQLEKSEIKYQLEDYDINAVNVLYAGASFMGKKIFVPFSKIEEAKNVLGLGDESKEPIKMISEYKTPFLYKLMAIMILLLILSGIIIRIIAMINSFLN